MIIYDYVSRAKLKSSHIVFSLKREYDNRREMSKNGPGGEIHSEDSF